jgi:hypothetical protein
MIMYVPTRLFFFLVRILFLHSGFLLSMDTDQHDSQRSSTLQGDESSAVMGTYLSLNAFLVGTLAHLGF